MQKNYTNQNKGTSEGTRLFFKSAAWTLIAIALIAAGYFGADWLSGIL